jgi:carbamoyl-phosphate synthase large subunit
MALGADIRKVLVIGAGPETIGQGSELGAAVWQACRVLKAAGLKTVVVESNLASHATDLQVAGRTYVEPMNFNSLEQIISREKPDAILPVFGGRIALNLLTELAERGILEKFHLKTLGISPASLVVADNTDELRKLSAGSGMGTIQGAVARNINEGFDIGLKIGFPLALRPLASFAGVGGTIVYNQEEFGEYLERSFEISPVKQVLIEESMEDWRQYEIVALRDWEGNVLLVAALESIEPMGVHSGDSIRVMPAPGLSPADLQFLAANARQLLNRLDLTGGATLRYARNPGNTEWVLVDLNPRYSLSAALAARAVDSQLAGLWTGLTLRRRLSEWFAPEIIERGEGLVKASGCWGVALPRFESEKFPAADCKLAMTMKSVGVVLAFGAEFKEAFQKALRSLGNGCYGLGGDVREAVETLPATLEIKQRLINLDPSFIFYVRFALKSGFEIAEIASLSRTEPWFLEQIAELTALEKELTTYALYNLPAAVLRKAKSWGFSDSQLANILAVSEPDIRKARKEFEILPGYLRVGSPATGCGGQTFFSTYNTVNTLPVVPEPAAEPEVMLIGCGPKRLGGSSELDYCLARAVETLHALERRGMFVECNPAAAAIDSGYGRVCIEPLTTEDLLNLVEWANPAGVILEFCGGVALDLRDPLERAGVKVYGTPGPALLKFDSFEKQDRFLRNMGLNRIGPEQVKVDTVGVIVEVLSDGAENVITGVAGQIEEARINSVDSACCLPPYNLAPAVLERVTRHTAEICRQLGVVGLMNIRYGIDGERLGILEVNLRAGQITAFICKATGISWVEKTVRILLGSGVNELGVAVTKKISHTVVKEAVFPFNRFPEVDPVLGAEMRSTGAVLGMAQDFGMAFIKSQLAAGETIPVSGMVYITIRNEEQRAFLPIAKQLTELGFELLAREEVAQLFKRQSIACRVIRQVGEGRPDILDWIKNAKVHWIISTAAALNECREETAVRSATVERGIPITTTIAGAMAAVQGMTQYRAAGHGAKALQDYAVFNPALIG